MRTAIFGLCQVLVYPFYVLGRSRERAFFLATFLLGIDRIDQQPDFGFVRI